MDFPPIVYHLPGMENASVQRDVIYQNAGSVDLKLDVYAPKDLPDGARLPGMVFIHGGPVPAEMRLRVKDTRCYRSWGALVAASGLVGVTFDHRYDDYTCLEQADGDVVAAVDHVRQHADQFHLDPDRLCLWVCSGGGPFLRIVFEERPAFVRCLVIYYAMLDLRPFDDLGKLVGSETLAKYSPVAQLESKGLEIPTLVARAGLDSPVLNQSLDSFVQKALAANAPLDLINHPRGHHAFDIFDDDARSRAIIARTIAFVKEAVA